MVLSVLMCGLGAVARAEDAPAGAEPEASPVRASGDVGPAPAEPAADGETAGEAERRARARELFERGKTAYEAGQFASALEAWEACYALASTPRERARALWILAQAYRKSGQCQRARETYAAYLESPAADEAGQEARAWLEQLESQCPASGQPPAPALAPRATPSVEPSQPPASLTLGTEVHAAVSPMLLWSVFGAAAASAVASGVSASAGHAAKKDFHRLGREALQARQAPDDSAVDGALGDKLAATERRGQRYNTLAWLFAGGSAAFSGVGAALLLLPERRPKETSWSFTLTPHAGFSVGCGAAF